jgi:putative methyltransferase (TIGR04325 family)
MVRALLAGDEAEVSSHLLYCKSLEGCLKRYLSEGKIPRVLDIGGGIGQLAAFFSSLNVQWFIVDGQQNCRAGRAIFSGNPNIQFSESLELACSQSFDVIVLSGAIQYIETWQETVSIVAGLNVSYLFLGKVPIGPTTATNSIQDIIISDSSESLGEIRRWLFSKNDLVSEIEKYEFELIDDSFIRKSHPRGIDPSVMPDGIDIRSLLFRR